MPSIKSLFGNLLSKNDIQILESYTMVLGEKHKTVRIKVAQGSVLEFRGSAIVNAANETCVGGGGVDFAITNAGGRKLAEDRQKLPKVRGMVRCPTGDAKRTGPNKYGSLRVPYVIHAVGPNYLDYKEEDELKKADALLRSAYRSALDCCIVDKKQRKIKTVAFSLLSTGRHRGSRDLQQVIQIGVAAIQDWLKEHGQEHVLTEIVICAFTQEQADVLREISRQLFASS